MSILGDMHNFGEFVRIEGQRVFKPRTLVWEHMFLSSNSELRLLIDNLCLKYGVSSPFLIAPDLKFSSNINSENWVERLKLDHQVCGLLPTEVNSIASMIGLCYWFGIGDLHHENVFTGRDETGRLICFPIDIEVVFDKMTHVNQTLLFPSDRLEANKCGLASILHLLKNISENLKFEALKSFINILNLLNNNVKTINLVVLKMSEVSDSFVRVILRDTKKYQDIIEGKLSCPDLILEEQIQLERKEIPYFIRRIGSNDVYYYKNISKELKLVQKPPDSFNMVTSIALNQKCQIDSIKTHTAIYSSAFISEQLGLKANYGFTSSLIAGQDKKLKFTFNEKLEFYETN